ncbi:MAG TPA: 16S rRNA (guanine(527)-N(7))-methyltransferase RsmG [Dehalococcoidia bacterium]|nr:16S rRNA (guanine(527)-N(7))-methyltransferase RsmG [Dehalococcoidia bacterium]
MPDDLDAFAAILRLDDATLERLRLFRDRIAGAGFNLVSTRDRALIERRHIVESLAFGRLLDERGLLPAGAKVLDIGAGAGLPGLPLRLAWPSLRIALLESSAKKARFIESAAQALDLDDVDVLDGRAEDIARDPAHREAYDLVVVRAVAPLAVLIEYALPFLRVGGRLAALKGPAAESEVEAAAAAVRELNGRIVEVAPFQPPGGESQRVVIVEKTAPTPERYPRRAGMPSKRPLS